MKEIKINFKKMKNIGYDYVKITTNSVNEDICIDEYNNGKIEFEQYFFNFFPTIFITIYAGKEKDMVLENEKLKEIGYLEGTYFPSRATLGELGVEDSICSIADDVGWDTFACVEKLLDENSFDFDSKIATFLDNVFYIDRLEIYPEFQNQGIASFLLANLHKILIYKEHIPSISTFVVLPYPFLLDKEKAPKEKIKQEQNKLIKFYKKFGFKKFKNSSYYYFNTEYKDVLFMDVMDEIQEVI